MKNMRPYFLAFLLLSLAGCKTQEELVKDLVDLKQDHQHFQSKIANLNKVQIPADHHKLIDQQFNSKFFSPWAKNKASTPTSDMKGIISGLTKIGGYGENKQKLEKEWFKAIEDNMGLSTFPNTNKKAITVANTSLRILPTDKGVYSGFKNDSEGYAFDSLQNSAVAANTPIFVTHLSVDLSWAYVETSFANGWIPIRDIAFADKDFIDTFKDLKPFIAITKDHTPIAMTNKQFVYYGNIGMILPQIKKTDTTYSVAVVIADEDRNAVIKEGQIPIQAATQKPMPLTIKNVSDLANQMLNQPYGWGGQFGNRDCSALLKDLYAPFGIWLPRNSKSQAQSGGIYINLTALSDKEKEGMIITNGIPYLTLLWLPGHIMLYIGEEEGKAIAFHNIWGIRTTDKLTRKIIGKSVITSLEPGKDLEHADPKGGLLNRVEGMTLLTPRFQE